MKQPALKVTVAALTFLMGITLASSYRQSMPSKSPEQSMPSKPCNYDRYFPQGVLDQDAVKNLSLAEFYGAMMEGPLECQKNKEEIYRVLILPSAKPPATVRIWRQGTQKYITVLKLYSVGIPQHGAKDLERNQTRLLTEQEWEYFQMLLQQTHFWSMSSVKTKPKNTTTFFLLEGYKENHHHVVARFQPEEQGFLDSCRFLLKISGLGMIE